MRLHRRPQAERQYGRNTLPRRGPETRYLRGGRDVRGHPLEMPSTLEGRCSAAARWRMETHSVGDAPIEELDLEPKLIARARAEMGEASLSQPRGKRNRRTDRSAESGKRRRAEHGHRSHRNTSPPFPQLGKRRPGPREGPRGRSANCGNNLFAQHFG